MNWTPPAPEDIKAYRIKLGMTQAEFAELAVVSTREVQRWEQPTKTVTSSAPTYHIWELLMVRLGITSIPRSHRARRKQALKGE